MHSNIIKNNLLLIMPTDVIEVQVNNLAIHEPYLTAKKFCITIQRPQKLSLKHLMSMQILEISSSDADLGSKMRLAIYKGGFPSPPLDQIHLALTSNQAFFWVFFFLGGGVVPTK